MRDKSALRGLVVVRGDQKQAVSAHFLSGLGKLNGVLGVVAARSGDDGNPSGSLLDGKPDDLAVLGIAQSGGFTCCAAGDDSIGLFLNLKINKVGVSVVINGAVLVHGSDDGNAGACKNGVLQATVLLSKFFII